MSLICKVFQKHFFKNHKQVRLSNQEKTKDHVVSTVLGVMECVGFCFKKSITQPSNACGWPLEKGENGNIGVCMWLCGRAEFELTFLEAQVRILPGPRMCD